MPSRFTVVNIPTRGPRNTSEIRPVVECNQQERAQWCAAEGVTSIGVLVI
jgi:hypothetical protein